MMGWLRSGFVRRRWTDMRNAVYSGLRARWRSDADLSDDSLPAVMVQTVGTEQLQLWQALEAVYYGRFRQTADGSALDLKGLDLLLPRREATRATGTLKATGAVGVQVVVGDTVRCGDGTLFNVTRERTVPDTGIIDVAVRAVDEGEDGNKALDNEWLHSRATVTLSGEADTDDFETFNLDLIDTWKTVEPGERFDTYQAVLVEDLSYPLNLDTIALRIKNGTAVRQLYYVYVMVEDADTGTLIAQTQIRMIQLDAGAIATLSFSGQEIDVADATTLNLILVLGDGTSGALQVGANGTAPYGGLFRLMGVAQESVDAWVKLTTAVTGRTQGGLRAESDFQYRSRQMQGLGRPGAGTPSAISGCLMGIDGVRHVRVDYNPTLVVDGRGVDPKSVRVTVAGGSVREIGQQLLAYVGAGIATCGSDMIAVQNPSGGPAVPVSFERPSEVPVYVRARVTLDRPAVLTEAIRVAITDAIITYIGGATSDGTEQPGLPPAEDVSIARIHAAICSVSGVKTAVVRIARDEMPVDEDDPAEAVDMTIANNNPVEIAVTRDELIEVI